MAFGTWLIGQKGRGGWVGDLAGVAAKDPRFPKSGDVAAARAWLGGLRASGDDWEALDDAEAAWQREAH